MSHELYIFGSATQGEIRPSSDIDVLVIPYDGTDRKKFPKIWSCYEREAITDYYIQGRLFAWHLHLDAVCVYSKLEIPFLKQLGLPKKYDTALGDVADLKKLLKNSLAELSSDTPSLVYELGLIYTSLRDIAMSASWHLLDRPSFSSMAPYRIGFAVSVIIG